jgi:hypothetical protein
MLSIVLRVTSSSDAEYQTCEIALTASPESSSLAMSKMRIYPRETYPSISLMKITIKVVIYEQHRIE